MSATEKGDTISYIFHELLFKWLGLIKYKEFSINSYLNIRDNNTVIIIIVILLQFNPSTSVLVSARLTVSYLNIAVKFTI